MLDLYTYTYIHVSPRPYTQPFQALSLHIPSNLRLRAHAHTFHDLLYTHTTTCPESFQDLRTRPLNLSQAFQDPFTSPLTLHMYIYTLYTCARQEKIPANSHAIQQTHPDPLDLTRSETARITPQTPHRALHAQPHNYTPFRTSRALRAGSDGAVPASWRCRPRKRGRGGRCVAAPR